MTEPRFVVRCDGGALPRWVSACPVYVYGETVVPANAYTFADAQKASRVARSRLCAKHNPRFGIGDSLWRVAVRPPTRKTPQPGGYTTVGDPRPRHGV